MFDIIIHSLTDICHLVVIFCATFFANRFSHKTSYTLVVPEDFATKLQLRTMEGDTKVCETR
jgi:hypothetical protein